MRMMDDVAAGWMQSASIARLLALVVLALVVLMMGTLMAAEADSPSVAGSVDAEADAAAAILQRAVEAQPDAERLHVQAEYRNHRLDPDDAVPTRDRVWDLDIHVAVPHHYHVIQSERGDPEASTTFISDGETRWTVEVEFADEAPLVTARPVQEDSEGTISWINEFFPLDAERLQREFDFALAEEGDEAAAEANAEGSGAQGDSTLLIGEPVTPRMDKNMRRLLLRIAEDGRLLQVRVEDHHDNAMEWTVQEIEPDPDFPMDRFQYE